MNNNEFEYSEKTKRRVRIFKRILSFIVLILAIATMVALFYVKKKRCAFACFLIITIYCDEYCLNLPKTFKEIRKL